MTGVAHGALYDASSFASAVVSYSQGSNPAVDAYTGMPFTDPTTALGPPTVDTAGDGFNIPISTAVPVVPVYQAFRSYEMVSIGAGGSLVLKFDHPVENDPANPFGLDFTLFGNSTILASGTWRNGDPNATTLINFIFSEPGTVSVSKDGVNWVSFVNGPYADSYAPTLGRVYTGVSGAWWGAATDPTVPLNPSVTLASLSGKTVAQAAQAFGNSAGGISFDLATIGVDWFQYIKIDNAAGNGYSPEVDAVAAVAPNQWVGSNGAAFAAAGNWSFGIVPVASADFHNSISADTTVSLNAGVTLQHVGFDAVFHYTVAGSSTLTLQGAAGAIIMVDRGQHTIATPVHVMSNLSATVWDADAMLTLTGTLTVDAGVAITKDGAGLMALPAGHFPAITLNAGAIELTGGTARIDALAIDGQSGLLTLDSRRLIISNGDVVSVAALAARITASTAVADVSTAVMSGADYLALHGAGALFGGQSVLPYDFLVMAATIGDADFSGSITMDDYLQLDEGYAHHLTGYVHGDFNGDGTIDARDYALIDASYAAQGGPDAAQLIAEHAAEFGIAYVGAIPEPGSLALMASGVLILMTRRRFCQQPKGCTPNGFDLNRGVT